MKTILKLLNYNNNYFLENFLNENKIPFNIYLFNDNYYNIIYTLYVLREDNAFYIKLNEEKLKINLDFVELEDEDNLKNLLNVYDSSIVEENKARKIEVDVLPKLRENLYKLKENLEYSHETNQLENLINSLEIKADYPNKYNMYTYYQQMIFNLITAKGV